MQPGDELDLDIADVAHGGVFVARHGTERGGRVVFVPDTLPGERVRVRLGQTGERSFWRGEVIEVVDASPHRRPHVWAQADLAVPPEHRPGGADFGHIELGHQRALKLRVLADALSRFGGTAAATTIAAADSEAPDGTGWRTRVSLHVDADGRIGPYAARSHTVVPVDALPLAVPAIEAVALRLTRAAPGRIDLVQPADGRVRTVARPERTRDRASARRAPREVVVERAAGREFRVDADGFWQVHRRAADTLSALVAAALRDGGGVDPQAHHLDLYGGVGLFAAVLGERGGAATRIDTVEADARATAHAAANLADLVGVRAHAQRVDRHLQRLVAEAGAAERARLRAGTVVLDPPRAGAGREVVTALAALQPRTVVYVACDPVALARDIGTFHEHGYDAVRVDAVDLFPHSHHLEAVALLRPQ